MASDPAIEQTDDDAAPLALTGKARAEAIKRLQIGLGGLLAMMLLVSLANIIQDRRKQSDLTTVPNPVASQDVETTPAKDPLADAGVVPEIPDNASAAPAAGTQPGNGSQR
jgi:hypothetical protein